MAKKPAFLKEGSKAEEARDKKMKKPGMKDAAYEKSGKDMKVDKMGAKPGAKGAKPMPPWLTGKK